MRILIATGIYPPEIGGPATYAKLLAEELPKRGIAVDILPFREVRRYPKVLRHLLYTYKIIVGSRNADLIFTQDPVSTGLPAILAGMITGKKVFMRVAGDYAWEQGVGRFGVKESVDEFQNRKYGARIETLRSIQSFTTRHAHAIITPSNYFNNIVSGWNGGKNKVITIYNGIDLNTPFEKKAKYEIPTIITAGRLVLWKGIDTLIEAMPKMPGWQLKVAGDGEDKKRLIGLAEKHGVQDRVEFLGMLPREKLFEEIYRSHIFALLSAFESFSFQIVEAMNIGTSVIAADIGNLREIITQGESGVLIEPGKPEDFAKAALNLAEDRESSEKLVRGGREKAKDFSIGRTLDSLVELFKSI